MNIIVQKYGGTSVGNIPKIKSVADRILRAKAAQDHPSHSLILAEADP